MPKNNNEIESRIQRALASLPEGEKPNFKALAKEYRVPYQRLLARSKGRANLFERPSHSLKLTTTQINALKNYLRRLDDLGIAPRIQQVVQAANTILKIDHEAERLDTAPPTVSMRWAYMWIKREPEISARRARLLDLARKASHNIPAIVQWFIGLEKIKSEYGIVPEDTWNFDETGFRVGIGRDQWILTFYPKKKHYLPSPTCRDSLTAIEAVNACGKDIPPLIILPGSSFLEKYFQDLPDDYAICLSETGFNNDEISLHYVRHFVKHSAKYQRGRYRLLLFDGFDSHCTKEFLEILEAHRVIPYRLPPHTSHILQPLDVGPFQPYKHWHAEAVDAATRTGCTEFNRYEFLHALEGIRRKTFKPRTVMKGWRETGLVPYRPERVLRVLRDDKMAIDSAHAAYDRQDRPQTPPLDNLNLDLNRLLSPAKDYAAFRNHIQWCLANIPNVELPPSMFQNLENSLKSSLQYALHVEQLSSTLQDLMAESQARSARNRRNQRVLQSEMGYITSQQARTMIRDRTEREKQEDLQKWARGWKGRQKAHRKAFKPVHEEFLRLIGSMRQDSAWRRRLGDE